jgi:hypothetical protein
MLPYPPARQHIADHRVGGGGSAIGNPRLSRYQAEAACEIMHKALPRKRRICGHRATRVGPMPVRGEGVRPGLCGGQGQNVDGQRRGAGAPGGAGVMARPIIQAVRDDIAVAAAATMTGRSR